MSAFVHGPIRCVLVAAALFSFGGRASAEGETGPRAGDAAMDGGFGAALDGGPIVDTYIDPGCGCRTSGSTNDARGIGFLAALLALAARRRNRSRHSLA